MDFKRNTISNLYHEITILDCPIEILHKLAIETNCDVTVENVHPIREINVWFESRQALYPDGLFNNYIMRNVQFDVALSNAQFCDLMNFWDKNGVYALFTKKSPIPFKATSLEIPKRYKALDNFGFLLEFALAGPASSGWSNIASPNKNFIDLAEKLLTDY